MGEIIIKLRGNARTGERDIVVEYESDPDATPLEHERRHREIVEKLVKDGAITREEADRVVFEERQAPLRQDESLREGQG